MGLLRVLGDRVGMVMGWNEVLMVLRKGMVVGWDVREYGRQE